MSNIIIAGFTTEGSTDVRFLKSVIQRTFEDVAGECNSDIEVHDIQYIPTGKGSFREEILKAAIHADEIGVMVLCVHTDADAEDDNRAFEDRINPAFSYVSEHENGACKNLVAIVPIQMTEAWMLADKELFKEEIYTQRSNRNLGIEEPPEKITDPKAAIKTAIRIAFEDRPRRRQKPNINELYLPLGQKIGLHQLSKLPSYQKFKDGVRGAFHTLNFLQ